MKNPVVIIFVFFFCFIQFMILLASITSYNNQRPHRMRLVGRRHRMPPPPPISREFLERQRVTSLDVALGKAAANRSDKEFLVNIPALINTGSEDFFFPMLVDMLDVVERVKRGERLNVAPINNASFPLLIPNDQKCGDMASLDLLILIKSAPRNDLARSVIRETWGKDQCWGGRAVKHLFLLGAVNNPHDAKRIREEQSLYGDIIQQNFVDHYFNNTYKMMMGFDWAVRYCKNAQYVFFVDDDYYVHPPNVMSYLASVSPALYRRLVAGYVWRVASPVRTRRGAKGKWFISRREYPWATYPAYCSAGAFLVSMPVVQDLNIAMRFTRYLRFDDVFLGLVLHKLLMVPLHLDKVFSFNRVDSKSSAYKSVIASHGYKQVNDMFNTWRDLKGERFCVSRARRKPGKQ